MRRDITIVNEMEFRMLRAQEALSLRSHRATIHDFREDRRSRTLAQLRA
ncbi:hypothetical protein ACVIHI_008598 [Bradyrhizobium sp. USDA 4524]|nr:MULTISPECIES: hypothetical protein [unclassified Bradyrhizobium]MCP1845939.1 hypothetical protein [Bradyrhizobium sp. USDA 4538]MCP1907427.1 hypothetical protein [Bradyrhizobium sp. USDA 4537]MCP1985213.1 hypothetical protein [Bradyrhizobium sp. USDA 4539]